MLSKKRIIPILFILVFNVFFPIIARVHSQEAFSQTRLVNNVISAEWTNPANAFTENDLCTYTKTNDADSYYNFINNPFTIPEGATITGIRAVLRWGGDGNDWFTVRFKDANLVWSSFANGQPPDVGCADAVLVGAGGPDILWGGSWTPAHINSANFVCWFEYGKSGAANFINIDFMEITVYYTEPLPPEGGPDSITIQPEAKHVSIDEGTPNNYWSDMYLRPKSQLNHDNRELIQFDLSSIPEGAIITYAKLSLHRSDVYIIMSRTIGFHRLESPFTETTTWNTQPTHNATPIDTTIVTQTDGWKEWDGFASEIQSLIDGDTNYGWVIKDETEDSGTPYYVFYWSQDYTGDLSKRPKLYVEYIFERPTSLFGAGFNNSTPFIELHWSWDYEYRDFYEIQNSSDRESWTYLGQSNTANYTDTQVVNGTERYYRVRSCNETNGGWDNSTWSYVDFEKVYFIPGDGEIIIVESDLPWIAIAIALSIIVLLLSWLKHGD